MHDADEYGSPDAEKCPECGWATIEGVCPDCDEKPCPSCGWPLVDGGCLGCDEPPEPALPKDSDP
jgi:hypothetical protein